MVLPTRAGHWFALWATNAFSAQEHRTQFVTGLDEFVQLIWCPKITDLIPEQHLFLTQYVLFGIGRQPRPQTGVNLRRQERANCLWIGRQKGIGLSEEEIVGKLDARRMVRSRDDVK